MADTLALVVILALLLVECLLAEAIDRRKRDNDIVNDIALDFLKIFHDIKQIRSTIPNHGFTNLTFDTDIARSLLHENINSKRATITNPRKEIRDSIDKELFSSPLATDVVLTDFQARHSDPFHKRHGVGEGLAALPDNVEKGGVRSGLALAPDKLNNSAAHVSSVNMDQNTTSHPLVAISAPSAKDNKSSPNTANTTSNMGGNESSSEVKLGVLDSEKENSTMNSNENRTSVSNNTLGIMKTLSELKALESQINHLMDDPQSNGTKNATKRHDLSERNMIFESKIKGFLAKLDTFKFSDVGYEEKDYYYKLQKHAAIANTTTSLTNSSSVNATSSATNNTSATITPFSSTNKEGKNEDKKEKFVSSNSKDTHLNSSSNVSEVSGEKKTKLQQKSLSSSDHATVVNSPHEIELRRLPVLFDINRKKDTIDAAFEPECSDTKKCPGNKYCRHFECFDCHHKHHECVAHEQCCDGMPCIYGRCDVKGKSSPGTICKNDADCLNGCCVLEPTINLESGICKIKLAEYHQCSPVLYRKVWIGDKKPTCGPCQDHLECTNKGVIATHLVCMKKGSTK